MSIQNINYNTKEALQDDETVPIENKVTANDMNEIKSVVNNNADELTSTRRKLHDDKEELLDYITDISLDVNQLRTTKVDKVTGKGLSTNDYTNEEKAQLSTNTTNIATLTTESGHTIELSLNNTTFVLTLKLKNKAGTIISTSNVDLPLESMIVNGSYDSTNKKLILTLQSGQTIKIPIADLISGLQAEITEQNKLSSDLVDDTNKTHKFVTANEKSQIIENKNDIEKLQTKVTNLEETVNSELEDGVATGTEITVNDSANADASLLTNGNTSQNQYEGRNQFNKSANANVSNNLRTELDTGERISVGGSATTSAVFSAWAVLDLTNHVGKTIRAKAKFTVSGNNKGRYYIGLGNSNGGNRTIKVETNVSDTEISFIVPELEENQNYLILALYGNYSGSASANDYIDYEDIMITINNENLDYEKYVGGQASPNPTYTQDVHVLKGSNRITISNSDNTKQQVKTLTLPNEMEMCKIADYKDEFVKDLSNNKWYKNKKILKSILNGSENWHISASFTGAFYCNIGNYINPYSTDIKIYILSNTYLGTYRNNINNLQCCIAVIYNSNGNNGNILIKDTTYTTVEELKTALSNNNIIIYGVLATPVLEEITDTTLIAELDELLEIRTYLGQTNITVEAEDLEPMMTLNYKKSNRALRSEIDTIKARLDLLEN